jgi:two-component system, chemotaxis family, protein-glutamate methylesterase/glutaminase
MRGSGARRPGCGVWEIVGIPSSRTREPVIALVSSAGGLDALGRVLKTLPARLPASVIALQHTDPARASRLALLLDRLGPLPAADARDGVGLAPGSVIVAPSGFHTLIARDRTVALVRSGRRPPDRPSADLLLTSLAVAVGPDAIAVVLTGLGHDGAAGATAIKRLGGTLIASSLATSEQTSMPEAAIDTGQVDHVLALDEIGAALTKLASQ